MGFELDFPGRLIAGLMAVILITVFVLPYVAESQSENIDCRIEEMTQEFSGSIREKGYLDKDMYNEYMSFLDSTGDLYEVEMKDIHPVTGEDVAMSIPQEELQVLTDTTGLPYQEIELLSNEGNASNVSLLANKTSGMFRELSFANEPKEQGITLFSTHTHTADCYAGTPHICNGTDCSYAVQPVIVGAFHDGLKYSYDAVTWTTAVQSYDIKKVTYGNGRFVAIASGFSGSSTAVLYSSDGKTWGTIPFTNKELYNIAFGNGGFMMIGNYCGTDTEVAYFSRDGVNWSLLFEDYGANTQYSGVAAAGNSFLFGKYDSSYGYFSSYNWNGSSLSYGGTWRCDYGKPCYVGSAKNRFIYTIMSTPYLHAFSEGYSSNSYRASGTICSSYQIDWGSVVYGNNQFLAYCNTGVFSAPLPSDGEALSFTKVAESIGMYDPVASIYFHNKFVVTGYNGSYWSSSYIAQSTDGVYWTKIATDYGVRGIACNAPGGSGICETGPCLKSGKYYSGGVEVQPICNSVVTSISATAPNQTVLVGGSINATTTAYYLNGTTATITCTVSGYNPNTVGTQTVTLTYTGLVGNAKTYGTRTCTVTVTVKSASKQCIAGLGHPDYDGALAQCPVCKAISGITASDQTFVYDGNHHEINVTSLYGDSVSTTYYTQPTVAGHEWQWNIGPINVGTYPAHIYVHVYNSLTKTWGDYFVMQRFVTISKPMTGISVNLSSATVSRWGSIPISNVTVNYIDDSSRIISSGWTATGFDSSKLGTQAITVSYTENGITKTATANITVVPLQKTCPKCGNTYELNPDDSDPGCPFCKGLVDGIKVTPTYVEVKQEQSLPVTVSAIYGDGSMADVTAWTSNFNPNRLGLQTVTIEYDSFAADISVWVHEKTTVCLICGTEYPVSNGKCPICSKNVTSISVSPQTVTVNQGEDISLSVTALYADGSSGEVTGWNLDRESSAPGSFTATVSYQSASTTISLTVLSSAATICPICGFTYEAADNPMGCPVCSKTVTGIEAYLTSGSNLVQYGAEPSLAVVLVYKDSHKELMNEGYNIENYNAHQLGNQTIKVVYGLYQTLLDIVVTDTLSSILCPNGHLYYRNEDGSDPGCPYCMVADNPEAVFYYDITYEDEIIDKIFTEGIYRFKSGNYLSVHIHKRNKSLLYKMQHMFFKLALLGRREDFNDGGEVF